MYFVIFRGILGKKVVLVDEEGLESISQSFSKDKNYKFLAYDPENLETTSIVAMKHGSVYEFEVRKERDQDGKGDSV